MGKSPEINNKVFGFYSPLYVIQHRYREFPSQRRDENATGEIKQDEENICISGEYDRVSSLKYREKELPQGETAAQFSQSPVSGEMLHFYCMYRSVLMNQQHSQDVEQTTHSRICIPFRCLLQTRACYQPEHYIETKIQEHGDQLEGVMCK